MRSTRALIASLGASISLVAAATLLLLTVSAIVALEGWPGLAQADDPPPLVVGDRELADAGRRSTTDAGAGPVVMRATEPARAAGDPAPRPRPSAVRESEAPSSRPAPREPRPEPALSRPPPTRAPEPEAEPPAARTPEPEPQPPRRRTGDPVRELGDGLSGALQDRGKALKDLAAPISPEAGKTLEDLANFLAGIALKTSALLGAMLDGAVPAPAP